jgi:hypothetical protein
MFHIFPLTVRRPARTIERMFGALTADAHLEEVRAAARGRDDGVAVLACAVADAVLVGAFDAAGLDSARRWLAVYTESSSDDARRASVLGRHFALHPATREAVESGVFSAARASVIAGVVTDPRRARFRAVEEVLLDVCRGLHTVEDVETAMAHWAAGVDQDIAPPAPRDQSLYLFGRLDGGATVRGELDPETAAVVNAGLDACDTGPDLVAGPVPPRSLGSRLADAWGDMARHALAGAGRTGDRTDTATGAGAGAGAGAGEGGSRREASGEGESRPEASSEGESRPEASSEGDAEDRDDASGDADGGSAARDEPRASAGFDPDPTDQVSPATDRPSGQPPVDRPTPAPRPPRVTNLVLDIESLLGRAPEDLDGIIATIDGRPVLASAIERLLCDSRLAAILLGADGAVIDATTTTAEFTDTQRRLIAARDRGCVFPGCPTPSSWCDVHHLHHRAHGGGRTLHNGVLLCRRHHTLLHQTSRHGRRWHLHRAPDDTSWHATSPTGTTWTGRPDHTPRPEPPRHHTAA